MDSPQELGTSIPKVMSEEKAAEMGEFLSKLHKDKELSNNDDEWKEQLGKYDKKTAISIGAGDEAGRPRPQNTLGTDLPQ